MTPSKEPAHKKPLFMATLCKGCSKPYAEHTKYECIPSVSHREIVREHLALKRRGIVTLVRL